MFNKSLILCILAATAIFGFAQTPEPRGDRGAQALVWAFDEGSFLGVQTIEVTRENFAKFGLRDVRGVVVETVLEGSPAQTGGLQVGDVILRFNGQEVGSSRMLTRLVNEVSPDHSARITVLRGGSERELNVTVGKRPIPKFEEGNFGFKLPDQFPNVQIPLIPPMPQIEVMPRVGAILPMPPFGHQDFTFHFGPSRQIGVSLTPLTKQLADHFGVTGGSLINDVRENSPAAKAGLKAGDIITEIDGKPVRGDRDLIRDMGEKKEGDVTLTIVRNGNRQTVKVTPEEVKGNFNFFEGPSAPKTPGTTNLIKPDRLPGPMPLNQLMIPGKVI
jgi:serine protease Do